MKKLITIFVLLGVILLAACSDQSEISSNKAQMEQELMLNLGSEPSSLDPAITTSLKDGWVLDHLFEGLYTFDQQGEVKLGVAESVDESADGLVYTFAIREDARWSDGSTVTADDFEYAWKRALDLNTGARYASFLYVLKNVKPLILVKLKWKRLV